MDPDLCIQTCAPQSIFETVSQILKRLSIVKPEENKRGLQMSAIAYLRVSTDSQDINKQRLEVHEYARKHDFKIKEFVKVEMSSRKDPQARRIEELTGKLKAGDILVVSELSRLGRSLVEVINLVGLLKKKVRVIAIKQNLDLK